jgi:hypothetical protein
MLLLSNYFILTRKYLYDIFYTVYFKAYMRNHQEVQAEKTNKSFMRDNE